MKRNNFSKGFMSRTIHSVGEFGLIQLIQKWAGKSKKALFGIGDDAAVLPSFGRRHSLLAIDTMVEDVDFKLRTTRPFLIGRKALAINLSDIAAMGGEPRFAVVSLVLPKRTPLHFVRGFYRGLSRLARRFGVEIVGGDLSRGPKVICSIALVGEAGKEGEVYRDGVRIGDLICVTGTLGGSILGKHFTFTPRIAEGIFLAQNGVSAMMDISDGLIADLTRMVSKKRLGFVLEEKNIPISKAARKLARGDHQKALWHALYDGEDFELLFTVRPAHFRTLSKKWNKRFDSPLFVIGQIVRSGRKWPMSKGVSSLGYQHF